VQPARLAPASSDSLVYHLHKCSQSSFSWSSFSLARRWSTSSGNFLSRTLSLRLYFYDCLYRFYTPAFLSNALPVAIASQSLTSFLSTHLTTWRIGHSTGTAQISQMAPPTAPLNLDVEAISGICGSISIAAWVVVFSPQIIENFRRGSADGLSLHFLIIWLAGDIFNVLGSVLQHVLPTMIILAVYYTFADIVLLGQVFFYRGFTLKDEVIPPPPKPTVIRTTSVPTETTTLLHGNNHGNGHPFDDNRDRRGSDWSNLSPAVPMLTEQPITPPPRPTRLKAILWNTTAIAMVCAAGVVGWLLSRQHGEDKHRTPSADELHFDLWGQVFGWLCAALYLGSRIPQLLLNWRRKSTEGVSILFFLFACLGNLTYVLSIMAYEPRCAHHHCRPGETGDLYGRYLLVNSSWLAGSFGTLILDMGVFIQFFIYGDDTSSSVADDEETLLEDDDHNDIDESRWDQRPLLERGDSDAH